MNIKSESVNNGRDYCNIIPPTNKTMEIKNIKGEVIYTSDRRTIKEALEESVE